MGMVRVYNDNIYPFEDEFKGDKIKIPAKGFIEMEYYDAHAFKGKYYPIKRDFDNQPLPQSFKMIRVEENIEAIPQVETKKHQCVACKYQAMNDQDLEKHAKESHASQVIVDEEAEKVAKAKRKAG